VHFFENHPYLDGFTEAHLVGKEGFPIHFEESAIGGVNLMLKEFDRLLIEVGE
jgi:hypothetical protein